MRRRSATSSSPGRPAEQIALVEAYAKAQGLWRVDGAPAADYTDVVELDLGTVEPALAGPKRPQDRVPLRSAQERLPASMKKMAEERAQKNPRPPASAPAAARRQELRDPGRRGAHRGDHELHQHLESRGAGRRRAAGAQGARAAA